MSEDRTTIAVSKGLRDKLKDRREYPKEKLENVIKRQIGEKTTKTETDTQDVLNRIDDLETNLTTQIERLQKYE